MEIQEVTISVTDECFRFFVNPERHVPVMTFTVLVDGYKDILEETWKSLCLFHPDRVFDMLSAFQGTMPPASYQIAQGMLFMEMYDYYFYSFGEDPKRFPKGVNKFLEQIAALSQFEEYALLILLDWLLINEDTIEKAHQYLDYREKKKVRYSRTSDGVWLPLAE